MKALNDWWPSEEGEEPARLSCICEVEHEKEVLEWVVGKDGDQEALGPRGGETDLQKIKRYAAEQGVEEWQAEEELKEEKVMMEVYVEAERRKEQEERKRGIEEMQGEWKTEQTYKQRQRRRKAERNIIGLLKTIEPERGQCHSRKGKVGGTGASGG